MINWELLKHLFTSPLAYILYILIGFWVVKVLYNLYKYKKNPEESE